MANMPFITFEGVDGSGKSSLLQLLSEFLKKDGHTVEMTKEPGGTDLGIELRRLLLKTTGQAPTPRAELLIYEADRAQHVETKIKPLLSRGVWVLSDRFSDSSLAFQGAGRNISSEDVIWLNEFATGKVTPDLTVLVDCDVDVAASRRSDRKIDRLEGEKKEFHQKVRNGFLEIAKNHSQRFLVLNSERQSAAELLAILTKRIKNL